MNWGGKWIFFDGISFHNVIDPFNNTIWHYLNANRHSSQSKPIAILFNKRILNSGTLAKYAVVLLGVSRSSMVRLSSVLSLVISACRALTASINFSSGSLSFRVQVYRRPQEHLSD